MLRSPTTAQRRFGAPPRRALATLGGLLALCLAAPAAADVYSPWVVGVAPSYAYVLRDDSSEPKGGGANLYAHYRLTDALALRLSAQWSGHSVGSPSTSSDRLFQVYSFDVGGRYELDMVDLTPALEVGLGLLHRRFRGGGATDLGLQFGVAVDYWILDRLSLGAALHYHAFLSNPTQYPVYFDAGPRIGTRWR